MQTTNKPCIHVTTYKRVAVYTNPFSNRVNSYKVVISGVKNKQHAINLVPFIAAKKNWLAQNIKVVYKTSKVLTVIN